VDDRSVIEDILRVGTSAGGARAKAILAWNPTTDEFRSGSVDVTAGFEYWLMKFDGLESNRDRELADPQGYGLVEYAYARMATEAGIFMAECRVHRAGGRSHFMTKRFDRTASGAKRHMQSLAALRHFDFNQAGAYSYEQIFEVIRQLHTGMEDAEQQFRRAVFNVLARNRDDHVKNVAFLMSKDGRWRLSPAFDVTYAWNSDGQWTGRHQMSINGKRDFVTHDDLVALASRAGIKGPRAKAMIAQVGDVVARWGEFAEEAGISAERTRHIANALTMPA
jgi:serine/threonine-protein kinase HipA